MTGTEKQLKSYYFTVRKLKTLDKSSREYRKLSRPIRTSLVMLKDDLRKGRFGEEFESLRTIDRQMHVLTKLLLIAAAICAFLFIIIKSTFPQIIPDEDAFVVKMMSAAGLTLLCTIPLMFGMDITRRRAVDLLIDKQLDYTGVLTDDELKYFIDGAYTDDCFAINVGDPRWCCRCKKVFFASEQDVESLFATCPICHSDLFTDCEPQSDGETAEKMRAFYMNEPCLKK